ncbi:MAG: AAA family ATPase [Luteolibacter sp.]
MPSAFHEPGVWKIRSPDRTNARRHGFRRPPLTQESGCCMKAFQHQVAPLQELHTRAEILFAGHWRQIPSVRVRFSTLVAGGTGTGKSALTELLATSVGSSLLRIAVPGWIPNGSNNRSVSETVPTIARHIAANEKTILVLDEIDKVYLSSSRAGGGVPGSTDSTWLSHIRGELYEILDGRFPTGMQSITDDDDDDAPSMERLTEKLRTTVFVVGIGTFQDYFDQPPTVTIGFGGRSESPLQIDAAEVATQLPRELSNRFHGSLVVLPELESEQYRHMMKQTAKSLPSWLQPAFLAAAGNRIDQAIEVKKGARFVEEALLDALIATRGIAITHEPQCM